MHSTAAIGHPLSRFNFLDRPIKSQDQELAEARFFMGLWRRVDLLSKVERTACDLRPLFCWAVLEEVGWTGYDRAPPAEKRDSASRHYHRHGVGGAAPGAHGGLARGVLRLDLRTGGCMHSHESDHGLDLGTRWAKPVP